jgi:ferredoxin
VTQGGRVRVEADALLCCGSGQCTLSVPEVFDQDEEDGTVIVLDENPPADLLPSLRYAEDRCPARAITVATD